MPFINHVSDKVDFSSLSGTQPFQPTSFDFEIVEHQEQDMVNNFASQEEEQQPSEAEDLQ